DSAGNWQQAFPQSFSMGCKKDIDLAPVLLVANTRDEAASLHRLDRSKRRWFHCADDHGKLPLGKPVLTPQGAQEIPHAERHPERLDLLLQIALHETVRQPDLIAD